MLFQFEGEQDRHDDAGIQLSHSLHLPLACTHIWVGSNERSIRIRNWQALLRFDNPSNWCPKSWFPANAYPIKMTLNNTKKWKRSEKALLMVLVTSAILGWKSSAFSILRTKRITAHSAISLWLEQMISAMRDSNHSIYHKYLSCLCMSSGSGLSHWKILRRQEISLPQWSLS